MYIFIELSVSMSLVHSFCTYTILCDHIAFRSTESLCCIASNSSGETEKYDEYQQTKYLSLRII